MEILRFENAPARKSRNKSSVKGLAGLATVAAIAVLGSTLAANISLNSGGSLEFGQGVSQTTACDSDGITVTPTAGFLNAAGGGAFNFNSVALSGIASTCNGKTFTINAYGDSSSTALQLATGPASAAISSATVQYASAGTSLKTAGITLSNNASGSGSVTLTFDTPTATSGAVYKLTLQSQ
jgi:hypothetical protein